MLFLVMFWVLVKRFIENLFISDIYIDIWKNEHVLLDTKLIVSSTRKLVAMKSVKLL